jgi:hypothetical protein
LTDLIMWMVLILYLASGLLILFMTDCLYGSMATPSVPHAAAVACALDVGHDWYHSCYIHFAWRPSLGAQFLHQDFQHCRWFLHTRQL